MEQTKIKAILRAASFVLGKEVYTIEALTDEQLIFFNSLSNWELSKCFAKQDVLNGMSIRQVANKYNFKKDKINRNSMNEE